MDGDNVYIFQMDAPLPAIRPCLVIKTKTLLCSLFSRYIGSDGSNEGVKMYKEGVFNGELCHECLLAKTFLTSTLHTSFRNVIIR